MTETISADFPFESNYVEVNGSRMHYVDEGAGDPVLFLHGNPTSSYLWRNIIPHLAPHARCIAPDLIGMGKSDKPDIGYRFVDHVPYIDGFIEKLGLENITLVIHDWGSALGFHYARRHEHNVKGIAFMEAIIGTARWEQFPAEFKIAFRMFRTPGIGWLMIVALNLFVEKVLPDSIVRDLSQEEMERYRAPYRRWKHRKPVRVWPQEIPIDGTPGDVHEIVEGYNRWLQQTDLPKLFFYAHPGGIIRSRQVEWCRKTLKNLRSVDLGKGIHFVQEDHPHTIGEELARWYREL